MKAEHDDILSDLLARWHSWMHSTGIARGFARSSAGFESYRCSRQYDDHNGALDSDLDAMRSAAVNFAAEQLPDPHRAAIYLDARNLCTGLSVWDSPRLPAEPHLRDLILLEARAMMTGKLMNAGVI